MKIWPYDPCTIDSNKYLAYDLITQQKTCPWLNKNMLWKDIEFDGDIDLIYTSSLKRWGDTAEFISEKKWGVKIIHTPLLNEVVFSMRDLVDSTKYFEKGSTIIREKFIEHWNKDTLKESVASVKERFAWIRKIHEDCVKNNKKALFISHTFFIVLAQHWFNTENIKTDSKLLNFFECITLS